MEKPPYNGIKELSISNFRSIDKITATNMSPFSVFAGPNGSGKSNFFNALDFVHEFVESGLEKAMRKYGGFENIHSFKRYTERASTFEFSVTIDMPSVTQNGEWDKDEIIFKETSYKLKIAKLDSKPEIEEILSTGGENVVKRVSEATEVWGEKKRFPADLSVLLLAPEQPMTSFLRGLRVFHIDPVEAKRPDESNMDSSELANNGGNVASMLRKIEKEKEKSDEIMEWMQMVVSGLESITPQKQHLDGSTVITFKEQGTKKSFPSHLVSDGTIFLLSLLVAVLDKDNMGAILFEEPERGIHPLALAELISFFREKAVLPRPIWLSTHNESIIRNITPEELWLVNKDHGKTKIYNASSMVSGELNIPLDQAWLSNVFGCGSPW